MLTTTTTMGRTNEEEKKSMMAKSAKHEEDTIRNGSIQNLTNGWHASFEIHIERCFVLVRSKHKLFRYSCAWFSSIFSVTHSHGVTVVYQRKELDEIYWNLWLFVRPSVCFLYTLLVYPIHYLSSNKNSLSLDFSVSSYFCAVAIATNPLHVHCTHI